jgi:mono/diheme cytochrome c family protein
MHTAGIAPSKKVECVAPIRLFLINLIVFLIALCCTTAARAQNDPLISKALFEKKCATCHGNDGTKGRFGAKNLQISKLNDDELFTTINTGKGIMPKWGKKLTQTQILSVIEYVKTLRK